jgi:hypothetical protein
VYQRFLGVFSIKTFGPKPKIMVPLSHYLLFGTKGKAELGKKLKHFLPHFFSKNGPNPNPEPQEQPHCLLV